MDRELTGKTWIENLQQTHGQKTDRKHMDLIQNKHANKEQKGIMIEKKKETRGYRTNRTHKTETCGWKKKKQEPQGQR